MHKNSSGVMKDKSSGHDVVDGSDIMELVENERVFGNFVDHKFQELDADCDGKLSVKELQPAVADLGAAIGLPAQGTSADSDHIYTEVISNILEPALQSLSGVLEQPVSQEAFLATFQNAIESVVQLLKEKPAIVAHSQNTFDGSGIRRLLSNKFELDKTMDFALKGIPKDRNGKILKEFLGVALDTLAASAGLPPLGALAEMDSIMTEALKMFNAGDGKAVKEDEFKKLLTEVLGSIMLQLEGKPVSVSINSVVHEPTYSSSTLLQPSSP